MDRLRLGFLASHGGSNMQAIIDSVREGRLDADLCVVICNNSESMALERARKAGIPWRHLSGATHPDPDALDEAILAALRDHGTNLVCLAGYMKQLGPKMVAAYPNRILNIHPSLLPKYGGRGLFGIRVHEAVLAAGEKTSGATIHIVDPEYDRGPVIAQRRVAVEPGDNAETLAARVLKVEHLLYSEALERIASGEIDLDAVASRGKK